jgi:hypothetical protein
MRFAFLRSVLLLAGCAAYVGCSGATFDVPEPDTGTTGDVGALDSTTPDGSPQDGATLDSTVTDSGALDGGGVDSGAPDTAKDTGPADTGKIDTGPIETGPVDTGLLDTGVLPDALGDGALCPRPNSTATYDPSTLDCVAIASKFPPNLEEARTCFCDADCNQSVSNLCGCEVWVSPANDAYVAVTRMKNKWESLGCTIACPATPCVISPGKVCVKTGGIMGKCQ